jgi:hypothetical protein
LGQQRLDVIQQEGAADRQAQTQNYQNLNEARALEAERNREFERAKLQQVQEFTLKRAETARQNAITDMKNQMRFDLAGRMGELQYMTTLQNQAFEMDRLNRDREGRIRAESNRIENLGKEMIKGMGLDQSIDMVLSNTFSQSLQPNQMVYGVDGSWFFNVFEVPVGEASDISLFNFFRAGGLNDIESARKVQDALGGTMFQGGTELRQDKFENAIRGFGPTSLIDDTLNSMSAHDRDHIEQYIGYGLLAVGESQEGARDIDRVAGRSADEIMRHMIARTSLSLENTTGTNGPSAELTHKFLTGMIDGTIDEGTLTEIKESGHGQILGHLLTRMQAAVDAQAQAADSADPASSGILGTLNIPGKEEQTDEDRMSGISLLRSQMTDMRNRLNQAVAAFDANGGQGSISNLMGYVHPDVVQGMFSNLRQLYMDSGSMEDMETAIAAIPDENVRRQLAAAVAVLDEQRNPIDPRPFTQQAMGAQEAALQNQMDLLDEIFGGDDG